LAGSPAITPSPFRGSRVICTLSYLRLQYVIGCGDVGVVYSVQLRTPEQSSVYSCAASIAMYRTLRRGASLVHVDDADAVFFGDFSYMPQQIPIGPYMDVIKVSILLRDIPWVANFNHGDADVVKPFYGLPYLSVYVVSHLPPPLCIHLPKPL